MATPKFDDTLPLEEETPSFEDTTDLPVEEPGLAESLKDVAAGALKGSLLAKISPALGAIPRAMVSGESIPEAYASLSKPLEEDIRTAEERSPVLATGGEIAGAILPAMPVAAAGKALTAGRELGMLGKTALGAGEGAAIGLESAIASDRPIGEEIETGAILGAAIPGAGKVAGKALEKVGQTGVAKAFKAGLEGLDLSDIEKVAERSKSKLKGLYDPLKKVMSDIYNMRQTAIESATEAGRTINVSGSLPYTVDEVIQFMKNSSTGIIPERDKLIEAVIPFTQQGKILSPIEADELSRTLDKLAPKLYGTNISGIIKDLRNKLKSRFDEIPELSKPNKLYNEFMSSSVEEILSKGIADIEKTSYGRLGKPDKTLFNRLEQLVKGIGEKDLPSITTKQRLEKGLTEFGKKEPDLLEEAGLDPKEYIDKLKGVAEEAKLYKKAQETPEVYMSKPIKTIRSIVKPEVLASKLGKSLKDASKYMYTANPESLKEVSTALVQNESTKNLGEGLMRALEGSDSIRKNAAIFAILQSPTARGILGVEESAK